MVAGLETLEKVVIVPFCQAESDISLDALGCEKACFFSSLVGSESEDVETPALSFEQVPFNHPLFIMYSSGTTGAPKCMVHGVGGTLMKVGYDLLSCSRAALNEICVFAASRRGKFVPSPVAQLRANWSSLSSIKSREIADPLMSSSNIQQ